MTVWEVLAQIALLDIAEVGYACLQVGPDDLPCHEIATCLSGWPTVEGAPPHRCCDAHARKWQQVASAMGFSIAPTRLPVKINLPYEDHFAIRVENLEVT